MERYGNIKGGKVIGVGSYGCVFSPAIPCKHGRQPENDMVSKLMETLDARKEMDEIEKVTERLGKIENAERYFGGFGTYMCRPEKITSEDLAGYHCDIGNIADLVHNSSSTKLPDLSVLQQKYLGKTVGSYLSHLNEKEELILFFQNMISLLMKGIIPMNEKGIYHLDIKSENVLVKENAPVIIDWGLSYLTDHSRPITDASTRGNEYDVDETNIPMTAYCMFNEPLVARAFYQTADTMGGMIDPRGLSGATTVRTIIHQLYHNTYDKEHMRYLLGGIVTPVIEVLNQFHTSRGEIYPYSTSEMLISQYLTRQRELYLLQGSFDHNKLYTDFYYNVDIWGWVMTFVPFLKSEITGRDGSLSRFLSSEKRRNIRLIISKMIEYLFVCKTGKYDVGVIVAFNEAAISML